MSRLFETYRAFHEQAFVPIFCQDGLDSRTQVEACVAAGCKGIEYTLRKPDAREMIPWIRKNHPELYLLVGSTVDSEDVVAKMRRTHAQLMTVAEIADLGVDGFVSMLSWTEQSIRKYASTHVIMPTAMTVGEALRQTAWGAHCQKLPGANLDLVRTCRAAATFGFCPILVTGGQTPAKIPASLEAGAILIGTGFDLIMTDEPADMAVDGMAEIVRRYLRVTQETRARLWPELAGAEGGPTQAWLDALPHWHPF